MQPQCEADVGCMAMRDVWPIDSLACACGVFVLLHVVVDGGARIPNHAHYRGRTTPLRLSVADVARVLRPHRFSICGFPREGREKIPNHAQWVLNHLRHGGARYPYNTRRFLS